MAGIRSLRAKTVDSMKQPGVESGQSRLNGCAPTFSDIDFVCRKTYATTVISWDVLRQGWQDGLLTLAWRYLIGTQRVYPLAADGRHLLRHLVSLL